MLPRLTRILLALVTAFVFTGQMEAAAQHCARLARAAAVTELAGHTAKSDEAPPCHEAQAALSDTHAAKTHHPGHAKAPDRCECIAALTACVDLAGAITSSLVEPYAWLTPAQAQFASSQPDPDLRPPRA